MQAVYSNIRGYPTKAKKAVYASPMECYKALRIRQCSIFLCTFFLSLSVLIAGGELYAQERALLLKSEMEESRKLLTLPLQEALSMIKKLSTAEAAVRTSQIRYLARKRNPDIDRLYIILRHLETLRATELAQRRLDNLLWVIAMSLLLFSSFLFYIYINQRRAFRDIQNIVKKQKDSSTALKPSLYRGED